MTGQPSMPERPQRPVPPPQHRVRPAAPRTPDMGAYTTEIASVGPVELIDAVPSAQSTTTAITKKPSGFLRVGLVAALGLVGVAGAFAIRSALVEPAGPQTPDDAVAQLFSAVENEDVLGAAEILLPSERESLVEPSLELFDEIERIGVVEEGTDLGAVGGFDIEIEGLTYESTPIGDGVVNVVITGGIVTTTTTPSELPVGEALTERMDESLDAQPIETSIEDLADDDLRFTVVEEDGGWYVSLYYTAAEAIRASEGSPAPRFGEGPAPVGAPSPEAVIESMAAEMVELDWEGVLTLMDPREARVLYDYSTLYLPSWQSETNEFRAAEADASWSLDRLETSTSERRGRTVVTVDGFDFSYSDNGESISISYDGSCLSFRDGYGDEQICDDELGNPLFGLGFGAGLGAADSGLVVIERNGRWYLSLAPTLIGGLTDQLEQAETGSFDDWLDVWVDELLWEFGLGDGPQDRFESVGSAIDGGSIPTTTGPPEAPEQGTETTGPPATDQSAVPGSTTQTTPPEPPSESTATTIPGQAPATTSAPFTTGVPSPEQFAEYQWDRDAFLPNAQVFTSSPGWWIDPTGPAVVSAVSVWSSTGDAFLEIAEFGSEAEASAALTAVELTGGSTASIYGLQFSVVDRFVIVGRDDEAGQDLIAAQREHLLFYIAAN